MEGGRSGGSPHSRKVECGWKAASQEEVHILAKKKLFLILGKNVDQNSIFKSGHGNENLGESYDCKRIELL